MTTSPPGRHGASYRPDVDGLRAIAVLAVVVFHAAPTLLPGGYMGVDVFFVISGYVITSLLDSQMAAGQFRFSRFYLRRIRRIIPPLLIMSATTLAVAFVLFTPANFRKVGQSALASSFFFANYYFERQAGYFFGPVHDWPLLHTWSLSVEEQFYFVWPALLFVCGRLRGRAGRLVVVAGLTLASLVVSEHLAHSSVNEAFYSIFSRSWELGLGALAALSRDWTARWRHHYGAPYLGMALIGVAIVHFGHTAFPGVHALPVTVGTAMLIVGNGVRARHAGNLVRAVLCRKPVVYVGLISYSLYLWHWPIFCFLHLLTGGIPSAIDRVAAAALAFALASLSYRFVETPIRTEVAPGRYRLRNAQLILACSSVSVVIGAIGAAGHVTGGFAGHLGTSDLRWNEPEERARASAPACTAASDDRLTCSFGPPGQKPTILVWGDSHASVIGRALAFSDLATRFRLVVAANGACPPVVGMRVFDEKGIEVSDCEDFNRQIEERIARKDLVAVVLAARWSLYVGGTALGATPGSRILAKEIGTGDRSAARQSGTVFEGLENLLRARRPGSLPVLIVGQPPEFPMAPANCVFSRYASGMLRQKCGISSAQLRERWNDTVVALSSIARSAPAAAFVDLVPSFCDGVTCTGVDLESKTLLFEDDNHLSYVGSGRVAALLARSLVDLMIDGSRSGEQVLAR